MKHFHYTDVPAETVEEGAKGVKIRWLITEKDGARDFVMRHFEIEPGGSTPYHEHPWEHEVFILGGRGVVTQEQGETPFRDGDVVFIPGGEKHNFRSNGAEPVRMLCLIPSRDKCKL